ncbi:MAG: response regulator [Oscillospiraceae bacterium]
MLKLLIVDDQKTVVDGLLNLVDWSSVGIDRALGAYSAAEARQILVEQKIDVMLCDIEMPVEDGLSLVRWMREHDMQTKCIFLTAHTEFTYAQKSVGLGAFDYVVQPASYTEIKGAVERAVASLRNEKNQEFMQKYGQVTSWKNKQETAAALRRYLDGGSLEELRPYIQLQKLPEKNQEVFLVYLQIQRWLSFETWSGDLLTIMMDNAVSEVFSQTGREFVVIRIEDDGFAFLLWDTTMQLDRETVVRRLSFLYNTCQQQLGCAVSLYPAGPVYLSELSQTWQMLLRNRESNTRLRTGVLQMAEGEPARPEPSTGEKAREEEENARGIGSDFVSNMEQELNRLRGQGLPERECAAQLYERLLGTIRNAVGDEDAFWRETLVDTESYDLYRNAARSGEDLIALARLVEQRFAQKEQRHEQDVVEEVIRYIDENLDQEIHRRDLAHHVYLNPDYLNRIFKKQTGKTLKEFVIEYKMGEARKMLQVTRLPVSIIAAKVGYDNFSHFSYAYKKVTGQSPLESRNAYQRGESGRGAGMKHEK